MAVVCAHHIRFLHSSLATCCHTAVSHCIQTDSCQTAEQYPWPIVQHSQPGTCYWCVYDMCGPEWNNLSPSKWCHCMETLSTLLVLCEGNHCSLVVPFAAGGFSSQRVGGGWNLFLRWWSPSAMWVDPLIFLSVTTRDAWIIPSFYPNRVTSH